VTDIFKYTFRHYRRLLRRAREGHDESGLKVLSELRDVVEKSDMDQDAINALCNLLTRALENKETRRRLIPVFSAKSQHILKRNSKIIELVHIAKVMGCSLSTEGDAFEWAANYYNKHERDSEEVIISSNVRAIWNRRSKNTRINRDPSIGLQIGVRQELAGLIGMFSGFQGEFCPVYFGSEKVDLDVYASVANFPELERAAEDALYGLEVMKNHRHAFARVWLTAYVSRDEISPADQ